jgi:hypothetical protein
MELIFLLVEFFSTRRFHGNFSNGMSFSLNKWCFYANSNLKKKNLKLNTKRLYD